MRIFIDTRRVSDIMKHPRSFHTLKWRKIMKRFSLVTAVLFCLVSTHAVAQQRGDFTALFTDRNVVEDVFIQGDDIYVKVDKAHWEENFTVKISNQYRADYRTWFSGNEEMDVKVYRSQRENRQGYTYRVNTTARYVEYWTNGKLVLHLERKL
jgi:hypothetical protein